MEPLAYRYSRPTELTFRVRLAAPPQFLHRPGLKQAARMALHRRGRRLEKGNHG